MKKRKLTLQQRLILPVVLLGLVTLLSSLLGGFSIHNVHRSAGTIVDEYMVSEARLADIRRDLMDLHRLALSHIVAADHASMIRLVQSIKAEEAELDGRLAEYEAFVSEEDRGTYASLLSDYDSFKHAMVHLVCASADSRTQAAYEAANGDVASRGAAVERALDELSASVSAQAEAAKGRLLAVYIVSLVISAVSLAVGAALVLAALRIIRRSVIVPIQEAMETLQGSSRRLGGVVEEVRGRTQVSSRSAGRLSGLTEELSAALEEIAGNTASITGSASDTREEAETMARECANIAEYSVEMRGRAEDLERSARREMEEVRRWTGEIQAVLDEAVEESRSVERINILTEDILSISSSTDLIAINAAVEAARAGEAGKGFSVVAQEIRRLADSCAETASHIQEVSAVVTGAVDHLTSSARELSEHLTEAIVRQLERSVETGQQYREDAAYLERSMESFNQQVERLREAMSEIAGAISGISGAVDGAVSGVTGVSDNSRALAGEMEGISAGMEANQEIAGALQDQVEVLANL